MTSAASAGVAIPPAQKSGTGSSPRWATSATRSTGARSSFARGEALGLVGDGELADRAEDRPQVSDGLDDVAGAGLALRADHRRAFADPPEGLPEVGRAADEGDGERPLVDVVGLVGRGQDLALVDVVDAERLEDLGLGEVADAALRHDGDRDRGLDGLDHRRVAHAGHAAVAADVGGHTLERHHGGGAGVLGDPRLVGGDDVHDHAAPQHLREAALHPRRPDCVTWRHRTHGTGRVRGARPRIGGCPPVRSARREAGRGRRATGSRPCGSARRAVDACRRPARRRARRTRAARWHAPRQRPWSRRRAAS